jgi:Na+/H+-dicarboxylate symporter
VKKAKLFLKVINELFEITMTIVRWIMRLAPLGIMGLLTKLVAQANVSIALCLK